MDDQMFRIGDVVHLKGDSTMLTVLDLISDAPSCVCGWFDDTKHYFSEILPRDSLTKVAVRLVPNNSGVRLNQDKRL